MAFMIRATYVLQYLDQKDANLNTKLIFNPRFSSNYFLKLENIIEGITSNRRSECYGEYVSKFCTYRPSRSGIWFAKSYKELKKKMFFFLISMVYVESKTEAKS